MHICLHAKDTYMHTTYVYVCIFKYLYTYLQIDMYTYRLADVYACIYTCIHIYLHSWRLIHAYCRHTDRLSCLPRNIHTYIHTCIEVQHFSLEMCNLRVDYLQNFQMCMFLEFLNFQNFHTSENMEIW